MKKNKNGFYSTTKNFFKDKLKSYPQFYTKKDEKSGFLISDIVSGNRRAMYKIIEYENLLDSSCNTYKEWNTIGRTISDNYDDFDAFICLHGTDTLAYTSSALSFMLENLGKLVIVTGSQIPLCEQRNDAFDNLIGSFYIATRYSQIPEVTVFFNKKLYRGNRVTKQSSCDLDAFTSPNYRHLVKLGIEMEVHWNRIEGKTTENDFRLFEMKEQNVEIVFFYPNMNPATLRKILLNDKTKAILILTFGAGNISTLYKKWIEEATSNGKIVVNVSQVQKSVVKKPIYQTGVISGIVPGLDCTVEAAYTKLMYLLSKKKINKEIKRLMSISLRGEVSKIIKKNNYSLQTLSFVQAVAKVLDPNFSIPHTQLCLDVSQALLPVICNSLAAKNDLASLKTLYENNVVNLNVVMDYDRRSPLHISSSLGFLEIVEYLVENCEQNMNIIDIHGNTPLDCAIKHKRTQIVKYLEGRGARRNNTSK